MESGASLLMLEDLSWMHNLKSAGDSVDEAELVVRGNRRLLAPAWVMCASILRPPWLDEGA